jgi:transposase
MGLVVEDDGWRIPDEVWVQMAPLLPPRPSHPLGCHNPRVPDRDAMNAILLVLRTGMQWNALDATGICSCSSAYRRFREWAEAGVFLEFWRRGLLAYDDQRGAGRADHERDHDPDQDEGEVVGCAAEVGGGCILERPRDEEVDQEVDQPVQEVEADRESVRGEDRVVAAREGEQRRRSRRTRPGDRHGSRSVRRRPRGVSRSRERAAPGGGRGPARGARLHRGRANGSDRRAAAGSARRATHVRTQAAGSFRRARVDPLARDLFQLELLLECPDSPFGIAPTGKSQPREEDKVVAPGEAEVEGALLGEGGAETAAGLDLACRMAADGDAAARRRQRSRDATQDGRLA